MKPEIEDACRRDLLDVVEYLLSLPDNRYILDSNEEEVTITLRFASDGAKMIKRKDSVRGMVKLIHDRNGKENSKGFS